MCSSCYEKKQHDKGITAIAHVQTHSSKISVYKYYYSYCADVIDHVPVDDNPAYITMKRITLNKNSAYETVNIASHYETVN